MEQDIHQDLAGKGVGFSGLMTRGFIAGVEGTIAVVQGVGEVQDTHQFCLLRSRNWWVSNESPAPKARESAARHRERVRQIREKVVGVQGLVTSILLIQVSKSVGVLAVSCGPAPEGDRGNVN